MAFLCNSSIARRRMCKQLAYAYRKGSHSLILPYPLFTLVLQLGHRSIRCCLVRKKKAMTIRAVPPNAKPAFQLSTSHATIKSSKRNKVTAKTIILTTNSI